MRFSIPGIKITIGRKLFIGTIPLLILIAIIAVKGINGIYRIGIASDEMLHKSLVQNSVKQMKITIQQLTKPANDYLIHGNKIEFNNFENLLDEIKAEMQEFRKIIEENSEQKILNDFIYWQNEIQTYTQEIFNLKKPVQNSEGESIMKKMDLLKDNIRIEIDKFSISTDGTMEEYIRMNHQIFDESVKSIILLGIFITFSMLIGGFIYAKEITRSIKKLSQTAKRVSTGDFDAKAEVKSKDEIENFANSFNTMLGVLERTTISRKYFNNILNRMEDSIIITDINDCIKVVNKATIELLGFAEDELIGKPASQIISFEPIEVSQLNNDSQKKILKKEQVDNVYNTYYTKDGKAVPVSFSSSLMRKNNNSISGMICIAHYNSSNGGAESTLNQESEKNGRRFIKAVGEIPLTDRELEIIKLIAEEYSNREIGDKLFISVRTVETHRRNIMQKLHRKSVISLVHYAILNDII